MADERLRRHPAARRGPIRSPILRAPPDRAQPSPNGPGVFTGPPVYPSDAVRGAVENTVAAAYALSDQLLGRGYSAASLYSRYPGGSTMSRSHFSSPGNRSGPGGRGNPWDARGPASLLMEPWLQMMRLWTDSLYMFTGSGANPMNPWAAWMGAGGNPGVSVEVQSARPVRVTLDLAPGSDFEQLAVGPLTASKASGARTLDGASISARPGQYMVQLDVPDDLPDGTYTGTVESHWRKALGELRVDVVTLPEPPGHDGDDKEDAAQA